MNKKLLWAAGLMMTTLLINAQNGDNATMSKKFVKNIIANADTSDWRGITLQHDKSNSAYYATANDLQHVHVLLIVTDPAQQMKLLRAGMEVWLNWKGKSNTNKATGIKYPLKSEEGFNPSDQPQNAQQGSSHIFKLMLSKKTEMELTGFKKELNGKHNLVNSSGVKIAINFTASNVMIYELSIPFTALSESVSFNTPVSLGIVFKAIEQSDFGGAGGRPSGAGGGRPGGGGRPSGAGGPPWAGGGNGGSQQRPDFEKMFKETNIWYKFSLAEK